MKKINDKLMKVSSILLAVSLFCFVSCSKEKKIEYREVPKYDWEQEEESSNCISFDNMQKDLETFCYLIETSYAGYEKACKNGLDLTKVKKQINEAFEGMTNVNKSMFMYRLYQYTDPYIDDAHMSLNYGETGLRFADEARVYYTDVFVEKKNGDFYVKEDFSGRLLAGDKIKCSKENLFYYPSKGDGCYRIGRLALEKEKSLTVKCNGQKINLDLHEEANHRKNTEYIQKETEKSIYFKIPAFCEMNGMTFKELNEFSEMGKLARDKDFVIIDVTDNPGGSNGYIRRFLSELFIEDGFEKVDQIIDTCGTSRFLDSPAGVKRLCQELEENGDEAFAEYYKEYFDLLEEQKRNPHRKYILEKTKRTEKIKTTFKGKVIVLANENSASAAEDVIVESKWLFDRTKQFALVGENTCGCSSYGDVLGFNLEESGICFSVPIVDFSSGLSDNWHGEGKGFYPDYWSTYEDLSETVFYLTHDEKLKNILEHIL